MTGRDKLIMWRKILGFTQEDMAKRFNMAVSSYCSLETGKRNCNLKKWLEIQKFFCLSDEEMWKIYTNQTED